MKSAAPSSPSPASVVSIPSSPSPVSSSVVSVSVVSVSVVVVVSVVAVVAVVVAVVPVVVPVVPVVCCGAAELLLVARAAEVHVQLGYGSFLEYMERVLDYAPRTALERIRVAEALPGMPETQPLATRWASKAASNAPSR